jgi:hypothetical protein
MRDNNNDNQLKLISQNIVGPKMILAEMARKYNDPKLGQRKKSIIS